MRKTTIMTIIILGNNASSNTYITHIMFIKKKLLIDTCIANYGKFTTNYYYSVLCCGINTSRLEIIFTINILLAHTIYNYFGNTLFVLNNVNK